MKHVISALLLASILFTAAAGHTEPAGGIGIGREPTSPAGYSDETPSSLPERAIHAARGFRGNPVPLGVLTGAILVVALGFGIYTVGAAYRHREPEHS
ncbi:MAG TPA: hypothetical protein VHT71_11900 [Methylomirabilota bacterium]|jgi:hypothetical protein|nr:hypothetical protein [Methylomirabilota bacterium]